MEIKDDVRVKVSNSEILLVEYIAVSNFNGNYYKKYVSGKLENFLKNIDITLLPIFRNNMQKDSGYAIKRKIRKGVETAFSMITAKFAKVIKATSIGGFLTKLKLLF